MKLVQQNPSFQFNDRKQIINQSRLWSASTYRSDRGDRSQKVQTEKHIEGTGDAQADPHSSRDERQQDHEMSSPDYVTQRAQENDTDSISGLAASWDEGGSFLWDVERLGQLIQNWMWIV